MLAFLLNNEPFAVEANTSIRLRWKNPACNFDNYPGDVGLGIEIPANDYNRGLLNHPERFDKYAKENKREFENFEIRYSGVLLMSGTLIIQQADNEKYSCWLRSNAGNIGEIHREKFISDSISFYEEKTFENKVNYDPDMDEYACPDVYNPLFFAEKGEKIEVERGKRNPTYGKKIPKYNMIGKTKIKGYKMDYSPKVHQLSDMWKINEPIWFDEFVDFGEIDLFR